MEISLWKAVGVKDAPRDAVACRRIPAARVVDLRAALAAGRAGGGEGVLFELPRGYGPRARAVARLVVGAAAVSVLVGLVVVVVAPSVAGVVFLLAVAAPATIGATVWALSRVHDTGVRITGDGVLRAEGWSGVREFRLADYPRVTVQERTGNDIEPPVGG